MVTENKKVNQVHTVYKLKDGTRVPSVTTILGILGKPALIDWSWKLGIQGLDYKKVRDEAGDIGTITHGLILQRLTDRPFDLTQYPAPIQGEAKLLLRLFDQWAKGKKIQVTLAEEPLVSEKFKYGGTPDFYGVINGVETLLDIKTSGAIYPEHSYQLAAYEGLLVECRGFLGPTEVKVLRFDKQEGDIEEKTFSPSRLIRGWEIFHHLREIYELQKQNNRKEE